MPVSERATESGRDAKRSHSCASCEACPAEAKEACDEGQEPPYTGWVLARMAAFYFLLPLACAIVCAAVAPEGTSSRSLAALGGLIGGMFLTTTAATHVTRRWGGVAESQRTDRGLKPKARSSHSGEASALSSLRSFEMASTGGAPDAPAAKERHDG